jgi:hypothetical protein
MTALLAAILDHTSNSGVAPATRHKDPSLERQNSRKRNWLIITSVLYWMCT